MNRRRGRLRRFRFMALIENIDKVAYTITGAVYGAAVSGLLVYGYLKSRPRYSKKEIDRMFRQARSVAVFEKRYLVSLAVNLAVREKTVEEELGDDIDVSRIPRMFNPLGEIVQEYYSRNKEERAKLKRKLNKLVGRYRVRRV